MIKKLHFKSLLLMAAMLFGVSSAWADVYERYSGEITEGDYIIAYSNGAMIAAISSDRLQFATISDEEIKAKQISSLDASAVWTITASGDYYTIYNAKEGKYAASNGTKNQAALLVSGTDDKALWTITGNSTYDFVNKANAASKINSYLRKNSNYGFACYSTGTGGALTLYKKVESSQVPSPTFSPASGTYTSTQNVVISTTTEGATIYYTTDGTDPTTNSSTYSSAIPVSSTTTIKAIAVKGSDVSPVTSATYTIVSLAHAGTEDDPYTVADARAAIDAGTGTQSVYATGIVSAIPTAYSTEHNNITFNFVDNTGDQTFLQAYRCIGDEAANVQVGDIVVVSGNLTKFNTTYEFAQGCTLVSLTKSVAPVITAENVNIAYNATDGNIEYAIVNVPDPAGTLNASVPEGSWLTLGTVGESVPFTCQPNTLATARTATVTLTYTYGNNQTATKDVTVTQAGAPTTASLPFEFDGGSADIEETEGLTQDGLGDYSSSPKLKFDSTGDWLILNFNERPGKLTFDIKGNSFSGGTFKVQTSEDGDTYTDLKTYTEISTTQNEEFKNLGENVRYIKWIYTTKVSGNVALGNIALAKYKEPQSYTLTVSGLENVSVYVFDAAAQNDPLIAEGGNGSAQVVEETQLMISPAPAEGYTLESLLVDGVDHKNDLGDDGSYTFTMPNKDITITATVSEIIPVETKTYTLATSITSGKHYVIASGTDDVKVMGAQNSNNRAAVDGTVSGTTLSVTSDAGATEFVIYGPDAKGNYTIYDAANGYLYAASSGSNHLKSQQTNNDNGKWSISFDAKSSVASIVAQGTNSRNVMQYNSGSTLFSCYGSASQGSVYLYEKDGEATPTETVHVTDAKYATYCSENALDFSNTGLTAYIAIMDGTNVTFEPVTKVPAHSGVLLKADAEGDFTVNVATTVDGVTGNALIGVTEQTTVNESGIFVLLNGDSGVGFYKTTANAFTVGAHTAYIPALPNSSRDFIAVDETTAIKAVESQQQDGEIYDLAGQRVAKAQKGLYIIGGKKVVIK